MRPPFRLDWLGTALWISAAFIAGALATAVALLTHAAVAHLTPGAP